MKLSNKILITFALALILIPLTGMIYISRVYYKEGSDRDIVDVVRKDENFSTPTENMESKAIATSFESINIADAKKMGIYVNIIKDEKFGVKVPKELKDFISFNVDTNGELQITFKNKRPENNNYNTIWVYAPNIKQVIVVNANTVNLDAKLDSLTLNVKKSGSISLQNDLTLKALTINTEEVKNLYLSNVDVKSLTVKLNGTDFKTQNNSYENLSIAAYGKSKIEISSYEDKNTSIKNLTINTFDLADVKLENTKVDNCKGSFSDQTTVQMPAVNLNQMFKK
ncbi:hypothetical protein GM921_13470 [Pedobacter sp. LMG 31464]|uniref:Putative auto-transporter adhesin head GIN domain-containing protein n=1 Tax=Pedobacter planticolens TaxID=2679964 RepID=A0A923IVX7_9SPHI|nr:DUF2807 domain-containing protein [Pedobacter planticolens]MBB2146506.1 hypothetical protein [Pedobacter planticolens]